MPEIIEKISAARDTFFRTNGFMPNTIKMSMADYRATLELGDPNINVGMRIVKRAGEMECVFDEAAMSDDAEIDYASESFDNYLGTKSGFDCYVMAKPDEADIMDSATLYRFAAEVSKLEYPKVKIDGKEYYAVDSSK